MKFSALVDCTNSDVFKTQKNLFRVHGNNFSAGRKQYGREKVQVRIDLLLSAGPDLAEGFRFVHLLMARNGFTLQEIRTRFELFAEFYLQRGPGASIQILPFSYIKYGLLEEAEC